VRNVDRVLEVDTLSGQTRRTLLTREHLRNSWCPLVVTPDGRDLVLTIGDGDRLALASTSSGAVRRTLSHHLALHAFVSRWHQIAGFDRDGRNVYVVALDEPAKKTQLVRWELGSGGSAVLFTCDADLVAQQGRPPDVWPRRFYCVPGVQPPRLLELPSPMVNETQKVPAEVHIRDGTDPNRILASFSTTLWGRSDLAFSPEGDRAYILSPSSMRAPLAFDLSTGQVCGHLRVPNHNVGSIDGQAQDRLVASGWRQPGLLGLLTGTGDQDVFLVCDLRNPRSVSDFPQPAEGIYRELYMSPDGRFFAASGFLKEKNPSGRYQLELLIYDVRSMPRAVQGDRD
jgi:WD40 repeat protein